VPLCLGGKKPLGTLWIVSGQEGHFDRGHARVATELASFVGIALRMLQSEQRLQRSLVEQETLAQEMSHRVKNLFAMTDSMIRWSAKGAGTKVEMARLLSAGCARLRTLILSSNAPSVKPGRFNTFLTLAHWSGRLSDRMRILSASNRGFQLKDRTSHAANVQPTALPWSSTNLP
jgi:hypothetical protein